MLTSVGACCLQEYNELSIVGSTRYVVEQGSLIRHVLTGREATSLFAVGASRDAARQLKAEMGDVNPHFMKWSGSDGAKFTFETPEAAAQAFEDVLVRTGGQKHALWSSLQPFIQGQREATMTQVGGRKNNQQLPCAEHLAEHIWLAELQQRFAAQWHDLHALMPAPQHSFYCVTKVSATRGLGLQADCCNCCVMCAGVQGAGDV